MYFFLDCPTRWGSIEAIITRLLEKENALRAVLSSDRKVSHLLPTWQGMHVFEYISQALSPIAQLTDFLHGENHVIISSVIPVLHNLKTRILIAKEEEPELTKDPKPTIPCLLDIQTPTPLLRF